METQERLNALEFYEENQLDIIPLRKWNATTKKGGKVLEVGKAPKHKNWRNREYTNAEINSEITEGHNAGWRLGPGDVVLDVDPKNGGNESLKRIQARFSVTFEDIAPTIITGSGGRHFYFHKDPSAKIREILEDENGEPYPGIEFKTNGRQVVIAGSRHPSGNWYEFDDFAPSKRPVIPNYLLELILRPSRTEGNASAGKLTPEELGLALEKLDAEDYGDQDRWLTIMMACHHATDGEGSEEFIQWSTQDPDYSDHGNIIRMRWDSLHTGQDESAVTYKTLYQEIKKTGQSVADVDALSDFDVYDPAEDEEELSAEDAEAQLERLTATANVLEMVMELDEEPRTEDLNDVLVALSLASGIDKIKAAKILQKKLKCTKAELKELMKEASEKFLDDIGEIAVDMVLDKHYNKGKHIIYVNDSQFWVYNGKYWQPQDTSAVGKHAIEIAQAMREKFNVKFPSRAISNEVEYLMKRKQQRDFSVLRLDQEPLPVINCQNGELWINEDGTYELCPHKYSSYLTSVLDVEFDPEATAPRWSKAIREIFEKTGEADAMASYFEEVMGYIIQPRKNIAAWWLLNGNGSNGKSLLCDVLATLCGGAALSKPILELDVSKNNHALETLPGKLMVYDDDMDTNSVLPDGILKKISERKTLEANPKGVRGFSFISVATPVMLTNKLPILKDPSNGTKRRAHVIPFDRIFEGDEVDLNLGEHIKENELPGVLNLCLAGLLRLRGRGRFKPPEASLAATSHFLNRSNTFSCFVEDCVKRTGDIKDLVPRKELYEAYLAWCSDARVRFELSRNAFYENCRQVGFTEKPTGQRHVSFAKIKLMDDGGDFLDN